MSFTAPLDEDRASLLLPFGPPLRMELRLALFVVFALPVLMLLLLSFAVPELLLPLFVDVFTASDPANGIASTELSFKIITLHKARMVERTFATGSNVARYSLGTRSRRMASGTGGGGGGAYTLTRDSSPAPRPNVGLRRSRLSAASTRPG